MFLSKEPEGLLCVVHETLCQIIATGCEQDRKTYIRIEGIQGRDGRLDIPAVNGMLDLLSRLDGGVRLLWRQVCLFGEVGSGAWVPLHRQVVQDQSVDVTRLSVSTEPSHVESSEATRNRG